MDNTFCTLKEDPAAVGRAADTWDGRQTIAAAIARRAAIAADSPALVGTGEPAITFSQLLSCISRFAGQLASAGFGCGDRVGLLVPAGVAGGELAVALASNIALVPVNPALTVHEMIEVCRVSSLKAIVIPSWLETPARPALLEQAITVLEAVRAPDGALGLECLTPAPALPIPLRAAQETDVALLLRSSGTTGAAKLIAVTHRNLLAMADKLGSDLWYGLGPRDRAACVLPLYYAAGLKTALFVPLILGASVAFPPAGRAFDIGKWFTLLKPTYLPVAPGSLNGILDRIRASGHAFTGSSLRFVMCASAYLPEDVRRAAESVLQVPVLEFYGLSEAGVMAANPVPPGRIKPGTVGLPAPGELLIVDENRQPVAAGGLGQIMISGPTVTPGYVVTDDSRPDELKDGWLLTGDLGRIDADGYLAIVGRVKEVINRGGEKVFPYEIEKAILEHPAVLEAAAFGVPHPRLGESVAAAVVLKAGSTVSEEDLKSFLAVRLAAFKLPRRLCFAATLPRGKTGKVLRSALTDAYAAGRREIVQPDRLLEFELHDIWERLLGTDDIGIDDDFFDKGGDSLLATEMLVEVEGLVGKSYPPSELATLTIRHIADVMASAIAAEQGLITQVKAGPGIPLFFCHGDYVMRGIYAHKLAALLPDDQPLFLLNCCAGPLVGSSIEEIARAYLQEVLRVAPDSPVFVGGYCNGGLAAWHLAHLLRSEGVDVVELLLVETMSLNARPGLRRLPRLLEWAGSIVPGRAGRFLREQAMREIWTWRRRLGAFSYGAVRRKIVAAWRPQPGPGLRGDAFDAADLTYLGLMSRYIPPRLELPVTCFIADQGRHFDTDPSSWRGLATGVSAVGIPGTHHTLVVSERRALAAVLARVLKRGTARYRRAQASADSPASAQGGACHPGLDPGSMDCGSSPQ